MATASVVCMDNGEPTLERCVKSIRGQPVKVEVIIVGGPRTDYELAKSIADKVIGPYDFIGVGRLQGIRLASSEYVISCDSDSIYGENYVLYAVNNLAKHAAVKAGTILPLEPSPEAYFEAAFTRLLPYEFSLAFRKGALLSLVERIPFTPLNRRMDIGWYAYLLNYKIDPSMVVWTRLPTTGGRQAMAVLPRLIAIALSAGVPLGLAFK